MTITTMQYSSGNLVLAESTPIPRHIWVDFPNRIVVYTGSDIPSSNVEPDLSSVRAYNKLVALKAMTPAQVSAWVDANVTNLATAQDAIKTLAIGVGYLIRQVF